MGFYFFKIKKCEEKWGVKKANLNWAMGLKPRCGPQTTEHRKLCYVCPLCCNSVYSDTATRIFCEFHQPFLVLGFHQFRFSSPLFCKIPLNYPPYIYNFPFVIQHFYHIGAHSLPFCSWLNNYYYYLCFCFNFEIWWLFLETNRFWRVGFLFFLDGYCLCSVPVWSDCPFPRKM